MVFQVREAVPYQILFNNIKVSDFTYRLTLGTLKGIRVEKNTLKMCSPPLRRLLKSSCRGSLLPYHRISTYLDLLHPTLLPSKICWCI